MLTENQSDGVEPKAALEQGAVMPESKETPPGVTDALQRLSAVAANAEASIAKATTAESAATAAATKTTEYMADVKAAAEQARGHAERAAAALKSADGDRQALAEMHAAGRAAQEDLVRFGGEAKGILEVLKGQQATTQEATNTITRLRTEVESLATQTAERSRHIEEGKKHADAIRAKIDKAAALAETARTKADTEAQTAQRLAGEAQQKVAAIEANRSTANTEVEAIGQHRREIESHKDQTAKLAEKAATIEARLKEYEDAIAAMQTTFEKRNEQIESLLPGATSTGLASAFLKRGQTFQLPHRLWQVVFVVSITGLLVVGGWNGWGEATATAELAYPELLRKLLFRLPLLGPLVWLAIYAARQATLSKRLEEDYAFKATVATSFEGFRKQMSEIEDGTDAAAPLARLCNNTLQTVAREPGRIYDRHRADPTPLSTLLEAAPELRGVVAEVAKKAAGAG